jgi:molybdopterin molybdotransferase
LNLSRDTFFKLKSPEEVKKILSDFGSCGDETVPLEEALGRTLSRDLVTDEDLPGFSRTVVDGYAVKAKDTFGASESLPCLLEVKGEVMMGESPELQVGGGTAAKIPTGGMMPKGADAAVMKEYCHTLDESTIEVSRAVSPLENVIRPGDDFAKGTIILKKGHCLRPQDLGLMAAMGLGQISVYRKPRVALVSTGDEIVEIDHHLEPGQIRDTNRYTLGAFCKQLGAEPVYMGLCRDDFNCLHRLIAQAIDKADTVWVSGGSSVGTKDLTLSVFEALPDFELLVHGISISPGKPTIIGRSGSQPLIGLPGHVASALVVAHVFMTPLLMALSGQPVLPGRKTIELEAVITRNVDSTNGREDYIRVRLHDTDGVLTAEPLFGKSGLISTLVEAEGLVRVDMNTEGLYRGQKVKVILFKACGVGGYR